MAQYPPTDGMTDEEVAAHMRAVHALVPRSLDSARRAHDFDHDAVTPVRAHSHDAPPPAGATFNWERACLLLAHRLGVTEADSDSTTNVCALLGLPDDDQPIEEAYELGRAGVALP